MHHFRAFAPWWRLARRISRLASAAMLVACAAYAIAASNVVEYTRDAAGNITQIGRQAAAGFAITSFDPGSGEVGAAITIYGTGFSATPANNLVKFNGTTATVTASQSGSISTTVPSGATTGRITVTVGGVTATSSQDFVVTIAGAPTISSFTPVGGASGTSVSVTGTNFNTTPGATTVKLNGVTATANVSSTTALTFTVPGAAGSGRITATTSVATGSSIQDFLVPPPGVSLSEIVTSKRATVDGSAVTIELYAPNTRGLVLFDGITGGYYTMQLGQVAGSPNSLQVPYSVIKPDNTVLTTGYVGASNRPTIHLPRLTATGTYSVLFSPGTATFASNIKVITDPVVTVDGATIALATESPDQTTRLRFEASGNRSLGVTGLAYIGSNTNSSNLTAYGPTGSQIGTVSCNPTTVGGRCRLTMSNLASDTYTAVLVPPTGVRITANALASSDLAGALASGTAEALNATRDGQNARYTFTGTSGENPLIKLYGVTTTPSGQSLTAWVYRPNGTVLTSGSGSASSPGAVSTGPLAVTGTYTVLVEPSHAYSWTGNLRLDPGTSMAVDGATQSLAGSYDGEALRYYFSGSSGQRVEFGLSGLTYDSASSNPTTMAILTPSGSALGSNPSCVTSSGCETFSASLPATGTYVVTFTPPTAQTISAGTFAISTPLGGTFTIGDPAQTVAVTRPGQTARYTFSGTSAQLLRLNWSSTSITGGTSVAVTILKPDGTTLGTPGSFGNGATGSYDIASLPTTGTYTVVLDPATAATMSASLSLVTR